MEIYKELIDLKYGKGIPTFKLIKRYPGKKRQIHEVALLGVPERTLKKIVKDKRLLRKVFTLKKKYPLPLRMKKPKKKKAWFIWW